MRIVRLISVRNVSFILSALFLCLVASAVHAADVPVRFVAVFGTPNCHECQALKEWWAAEAQGKTAGVRMILLDTEKPRNFELLVRLEKECGTVAGDDPFPAIYVPPKTLIYNYEKFAPLLPELLENARQCAAPPPLALPFACAAAAAENVIVPYDVPESVGGTVPAFGTSAKFQHLAYFFLPRCAHCSRMNVGLQYLEKTTPGLRISRYDITTPDGQAIFEAVRERLGIAGEAQINVPMIVWETGWHCSRPPEENPWVTVKRWFGAGGPAPVPPPVLPDGLVKKLVTSEKPPFWECFSEADKRNALAHARTLLDRLDLGGLILAGLIDGVNPCATATIVFLVGYLLYLGRGRRVIFRLGVSFCLGVFVSYFLIGIGVSVVVNFVSGLSWIKKTLYLVTGVVSLVLGLLSIRDAWHFRRTGQARGMTLGLSAEATRKIHARIREYAERKSLVVAGFVLGMIVSGLGLSCTGQIYLPVLIVINRTGMTWHSLELLTIYNFAFIVPLVLVTGLAAAGMSGKRLAELARQNVTGAKLLMAVIFLLFAAAMFYLAIKG